MLPRRWLPQQVLGLLVHAQVLEHVRQVADRRQRRGSVDLAIVCAGTQKIHKQRDSTRADDLPGVVVVLGSEDVQQVCSLCFLLLRRLPQTGNTCAHP